VIISGTPLPPAQTKSKTEKVFQAKKQHSKPTHPCKAHDALHGKSEDKKDFSQTKGIWLGPKLRFGSRSKSLGSVDVAILT